MKKNKLRKRRFRIGEDEKEIIKIVGLGLLVLGSIVFPGLPVALQPIFKRRRKKGFQKILKNLEEKGVIFLGGEKIRLTKKGLNLQKEIELNEISIGEPDKWDKTWRLVSYDIPDEYKKERDWFRQTLERLGFEKMQESLWVYPHECKEEIAVIAQSLKISPHIIVMATDQLPNQEKWQKRFDIKF